MSTNLPPGTPPQRCHPEPKPEAPKPKYHVEASGHSVLPDLAGAFAELPDFTGYKFVFYREIKDE